MQVQLITKFYSTIDRELITTVTGHLCEYKEGEFVSLQTSPIAGQPIITHKYEVIEIIEDEISLYGHSITREIGVYYEEK